MVTYTIVSSNFSYTSGRYGESQYGTQTLSVSVPGGYYISKVTGYSVFSKIVDGEATQPVTQMSWSDENIPIDLRRSGNFEIEVSIGAWKSDIGADIWWEFETSPISLFIARIYNESTAKSFEFEVMIDDQRWQVGAGSDWSLESVPYGTKIIATYLRSTNPEFGFQRWDSVGLPEGVTSVENGRTIEILCTPIYHSENLYVSLRSRKVSGLILHGKNSTILHGKNCTILTDN